MISKTQITNKEDFRFKLDFNNMMSESIGEKGVKTKDIEEIKEKISKAKHSVDNKRKNGQLDWMDLPYNQKDIVEQINEYVKNKKDKFDAFVVLGIGGSALGPMAVQQALNHPFYNELSREKRGGYPRLYITDNVDPERLVYLFDNIDITKTLFNVISKSGSTSETMSQFMIIKQMLEDKLGKGNIQDNIVCTTDKEKGNLIKIAKDEGYDYFIVPSAVGGRFSELCPVGLLPAAMCGIDIEMMLKGAAYMDQLCSLEDPYKNPALMFSVLSYIGMNKGRNISVLIPYADSLKYISDWYAQLWAESLGKKFDNEGNEIFAGQTPVKALGVTDQHSQIQLYVEGPDDKIVVFLGVDKYREEITIPKIYQDIPSLGFLGGATHSKLIKVEQLSTEYALTKEGKQNMTITVPSVNEFTIGQILYFFELATAYAGELLCINAFDQPGVEEGKNATYAMFGRPGYEEKKKELDAIPKKNETYII